MYTPSNLKRWELPDSYFGPEWFVAYGKHRDSDSLTRSNFDCILKALGGESDTVKVIQERHWAVGWVEWIGIHESDATALEVADDIAKGLEDYPVVDEGHWSDLEWTEVHEIWDSMSLRERIRMCADAGVSIFAARTGHCAPDVIYETLRG